MSDQHDGPHDTGGPLAVPHGGHFPAGWVSPAEHERAERELAAQELAREQEYAARAAREQEVTEHIARGRAGQEPVKPEPEAKPKPEAAK
jgi:hypothetical protein